MSDEADIVVITNTFTKKKKGIVSDVEEDTSEQLELLPDDNVIVGHDLAGYILVKQEAYQSLLEDQSKLKQLQSFLK